MQGGQPSEGPGIYVHIPPTNVWLRNKTGCTGFGYDQEMCVPHIYRLLVKML